MNNKIYKLVCIVFIFTCVLFFPLLASAQQASFVETGIEIIPDSDSLKANSFSIMSSSTLGGLWRYPSEERYWLQMTNATAYFRDVLAGAETHISGAADGETWTADGLLPGGSTINWPAITFYSSYQEQSNCFVSPYWTICGTTSVTVLWYATVQCQPTGLWTMNFYNNSNYLFSTQFMLLPQIYPGKVPLYNQGAYTDAYDSICYVIQNSKKVPVPCSTQGAIPYTIKQKGCALTSAAMVLSYHGVNVEPSTLNTWLINYIDGKGNPRGYDSSGNIYWNAISAYAHSVGKTVNFLGTGGNLENSICTYGPQIVSVNSKSHWVTPTGRDADKTTYLINDPNGGVATTLAVRYNNIYGDIRLFGGPEYIYTDITGIVIRFHSPGELIITDPQGRRTGYDPVSGFSYTEIPGSSYSSFYLADDETGDLGPDTKEIDIRQPIAGDYQLQVIGTDTGTYALEIAVYDPNLNPSGSNFENIPISPGEGHSYGFYYAKTAGSDIEVSGGFDGKGQRPTDVNKFLSYVTPTQGMTTLPAGATSFTLVIVYDKNIIPTIFTATLNGVDIKSLFHPAPGNTESVTLNLKQGSNTLILSVEGNLPDRTARDTDRLVFIVP